MIRFLEKLFAKGAKEVSPAVVDVSIHAIEVLIDRGDIKGLRKIGQEHGFEVLKLNDDPFELAPIHWAASAGNLALVRFYLDEVQEDPCLTRNNNFSPLHSAAMFGHHDVVELLLLSGADVNVQTDPQGYAPIHSASFGGHLPTIRMLLNHGADITLRNYRDELPIDTAKRQNQTRVVKFFENLKA